MNEENLNIFTLPCSNSIAAFDRLIPLLFLYTKIYCNNRRFDLKNGCLPFRRTTEWQTSLR